MYSTTGLSREHIVDLCAMIHSETMTGQRPWPPILGLFRSVTVALTYMRRNRVQAELAETCGGVHSRGLGATRRWAAVVELLVQVEHACGSCLMSLG